MNTAVPARRPYTPARIVTRLFNKNAALGCAARGWPVFAVHGINADDGCTCGKPDCDRSAKHPRTQHGFKDATTSTTAIAAMWERWPNSNIGLRTGAASGLVVLDVDSYKCADETLDELEQKHGRLPETFVSLTGGGGQHVFFKHPGRDIKSRNDLGPGLDIKADGGYVILPPSLHASGREYAWNLELHPDDVPLAELPAWIERAVTSDSTTPARAGPAPGGKIRAGQRHKVLLTFAGAMRRKGMGADAIEVALLAENRGCDPPLPEADVTKLARDVARRYEPSAPLTFPAPAPEPDIRLRQLLLAGVLDPAVGHVEYVLPPLIPEAAQTIVAASWKSGKTIAFYQLVLAAVFGEPIWGKFSCDPTAVGVLQMEMPTREDLRRLRRLALGMGHDPQEIVDAQRDGRLHHFNTREINLHARPEHGLVLRDYCVERGVRLLLADSLGALYAGLDFNDSSAVRLAHQRGMQPILDAGVAVVAMHHHNKIGFAAGTDNKAAMLGSQAWGAVSDRIYTLRRKGDEQLAVELGATEFYAELSLTGSWSPADFKDVLLHVHDDDDLGGTIVESVDKDHVLQESAWGRHERVVLHLLDQGDCNKATAKNYGLSLDQLKRASSRLRRAGLMTGSTSGGTDSRRLTSKGRDELRRRLDTYGEPDADR